MKDDLIALKESIRRVQIDPLNRSSLEDFFDKLIPAIEQLENQINYVNDSLSQSIALTRARTL